MIQVQRGRDLPIAVQLEQEEKSITMKKTESKIMVGRCLQDCHREGRIRPVSGVLEKSFDKTDIVSCANNEVCCLVNIRSPQHAPRASGAFQGPKSCRKLRLFLGHFPEQVTGLHLLSVQKGRRSSFSVMPPTFLYPCLENQMKILLLSPCFCLFVLSFLLAF